MSVFKNRYADQGSGNAPEHIQDVVVGGVDGCEPDAQSDHSEGNTPAQGRAAAQRVDEGNQRIGRVERGHGGEHIGVTCVEGVENSQSGHVVPASQAGHIAWGAGNRLEAMQSHIPRRSGGVNVVESEAKQVDQQECDGEVQIGAAATAEI